MNVMFKFILYFLGSMLFVFTFDLLEPNPVIFLIVVALVMAFLATRNDPFYSSRRDVGRR